MLKSFLTFPINSFHKRLKEVREESHETNKKEKMVSQLADFKNLQY